MDHNHENNESFSAPVPASVRKNIGNKEEKPFEKSHWLLLGLSLVFSAAIILCFDSKRMLIELANTPIPGAACTGCVFLLLCIFLVFYRKTLHFTRENIFMLAVCVLLALTYSIYSNQWMRFINFPAVIGTGALAMYSLAGHSTCKPTDAGAPLETLSRLIPGMFTNFGRPVTAFKSNRREGIKKIVSVVLALLISVPLLAIVLALLSSADAVFGGMLDHFREMFKDIELGRIIRKLLCFVVLGGMTFSVLYGMGLKPTKAAVHDAEGTHSPLTASVIVLLLDIVYILFVIVQFTYFFGGKETALMEGGYAEYARSGFFQLVAVAALNIAVIAFVNRFFAHNTPLTVLCMVLDAATCVILISAAWRMALYIKAFGLSFLRILTLWGIFVIGVAIVLTAIKMVNVEIKVFPVFISIFLVSWLAFNYMNVDRAIARYNVNLYLDGKCSTVDISYLSSLSPDVNPELERLEAAGYPSAGNAIWRASDRDGGWREWSFSELKVK